MAIKDILNEIESDIVDVRSTNFTYSNTELVPNAIDPQLTYECGIEKKGKKIETCVLYVDIRNSVALTAKHSHHTMGRIYTAFTKAILKIAKYHKGHVRNIIGDRVMIVFPVDNCFTNAVLCAISINHISKYFINKHFVNVDFNCGIGIDYGELRVIKVGIQRRGVEMSENKGLVWVGYPANIASRLTDNANKKVVETFYSVVRNPLNYMYPFEPFSGIGGSLGHVVPKNISRFNNFRSPAYPLYDMKVEETIRMSTEKFAESIRLDSNGSLYMVGGNLISFKQEKDQYDYPAILMTEAVFEGYKKANPNSVDIKGNFWKNQKHQIKNVANKVYGGDVNWEVN